MPVNYSETRQRDSVYRRGVLLGMTMAEIMILILFCLLMAFILRLEAYEEQAQVTESADRLIDMLEQVAGSYDDAWELLSSLEGVITSIGVDVLAEVAEALEGNLELQSTDVVSAVDSGLSQYLEVWQSLKESKGVIPSPEEVERMLAERAAAAEAALENQPAMEALEAVKQQLEEEMGREPTPQELKTAVRQMLADSEAWNAAEGGDVADAYETTLLENQDLKERMGRVDKALAQAVQQLKGKVRGLQYPSCFETPEGKTQFVFDIAFDESSINLTPLPVPGNEERWKRLKFEEITTGEAVPVKQYLNETLRIFNWSEQNACRFFVKIEDQTQAANKIQYKVMKRYIEYRFYTYEAPQLVASPQRSSIGTAL